MATPSRTTAVSPTKSNLVRTPTRMLASPRPGRPYAGKSPAVKTPASNHGHIHHLSSASHPSTTPNAVAHMADDLLPLNSPAAALLGALNDSRLVPIPDGPVGHHGLGIPTTAGPARAAAKDPETERLHRLQQVVDSIKPRVAGRGITREGIERLANLNGFALLPDEDNVTIAGNHCVDLEISFDRAHRDLVKHVVLKINATGEEEHQKDASEILARAVTQSPGESKTTPWKSLDGFAANLSYLSQMDHLSSSLNCFGAIEGLYSTFETIWKEEKKRLTWRNDLRQLCRGAVGQPTMDKNDRLGLAVKYWASQAELPNHDKDVSAQVSHSQPVQGPDWRANIACESGSPSLTKSQAWLSAEILLQETTHEETTEQIRLSKPAWQDPGAIKDNTDAMLDMDTILESSNVRFVSTLDPPVLLPLNAILALNAEAQLVEVDQTRVGTYQYHLYQQFPSTTTNEHIVPRRVRHSTAFSESGDMRKCAHSYAIYAANPSWSCPVEKLAFNHPKLLADALPILRQYALLWTMLNKLAPSEPDQSFTTTESPPLHPKQSKSSTLRTRSNRPHNKAENITKLHAMLNSVASLGDATSVDVSLDLSDASTPRVDIILPFTRAPYFAKIAVEVKANGIIRATATQGLTFAEPEDLSEMMTKVLVLSEDVGVLVEWIFEKVRHAQG